MGAQLVMERYFDSIVKGTYVTPPLDDISRVVMWPEAEWNDTIEERGLTTIDVERTAALATIPAFFKPGDYTHAVRLTGSIPYQRSGKTTEKVWYHNILHFGFKTAQLPLPAVLRRVGDPVPQYDDMQAFLVDEVGRKYYEISNIAQSWWGWLTGARLQMGDLTVWDLRKNWRETKTGTVAAKIPLVPMTVTRQELLSGAIKKAVQFAAGGYRKGGFIGLARGTDGETKGHPLVAGDHLQLTPEARARLSAEHQGNLAVMAMIDCLSDYGMILADKTSVTAGHKIRVAEDAGDLLASLKLDLARDFQVLYQGIV